MFFSQALLLAIANKSMLISTYNKRICEVAQGYASLHTIREFVK